MKKWSRPMTFVQKFEANEYVAACGTQYGNYLFECDAPGGRLYYYRTNCAAKNMKHPERMNSRMDLLIITETEEKTMARRLSYGLKEA